MSIEKVHAANVANRLFKTYVDTRNTGIKPTLTHLVTAITTLAIAYEQFFTPIPDGGDWQVEDKSRPDAINISQHAFDALERDTLIVVDNMDKLFDGARPNDAFKSELQKVMVGNTRDAQGHAHLDRLYIPMANPASEVGEQYVSFLGNELGLVVGRYFNFIPRTLRQTAAQAAIENDAQRFNGKLSFTTNDIELLTALELVELPECNDSEEIDHAGNIADLIQIRDARANTVQLDATELEIATVYQARFMAWMSYVDALGECRHEALEFAVQRVREAAKWAQQQAEEKSKNRARRVFGELAIA